jgi:hypothetical protein
MFRSIVLFLALALPTSTLAVPVRLDLQSGSQGGMGFSTIHNASGCELNGYWRCGNPRYDIKSTASSGLFLTADFNAGAFTSITGNMIVGGVQQSISGALDFSVGAGQTIGQLTVSNYGTFTFVNDRHGTQIANTWSPSGSTGTGNFFLWGQTFAPTAAGLAPPPGGWGMDLGVSSRAIPEPSAALAFGIGALLIGASRKRRA